MLESVRMSPFYIEVLNIVERQVRHDHLDQMPTTIAHLLVGEAWRQRFAMQSG